MFSVCIIDQNVTFTTQLYNELIKNHLFEKIIVFHDSEKGLNYLQEYVPDILILNHIMPSLDGFDLVQKIHSLPAFQHTNVFFITSFPSKWVLSMAQMYEFSYLFIKPVSISSLIETIHNVITQPSSNLVKKKIEEEVIKLLHLIGTPVHTKGYLYLKEAILLSYFNNQNTTSLTKHIYPEIAKKFRTTSSCTERAIRHTIKLTWEHKSPHLFDLFSYQLTKKPTNGQLISIISEKIRMF